VAAGCSKPLVDCDSCQWAVQRQATRRYWLLGGASSRAVGLSLVELLANLSRTQPTFPRSSGQDDENGSRIFGWAVGGDAVTGVQFLQHHDVSSADVASCTSKLLKEVTALHGATRSDVLFAVGIPCVNLTASTTLSDLIRELWHGFPGTIAWTMDPEQWTTETRSGRTRQRDTDLMLAAFQPFSRTSFVPLPATASRHPALIARALLASLLPGAPLPLPPPTTTTILDPLVFRTPAPGCDYAAGPDGCPPPPSSKPTHHAGRTFWFLGNSVTRHYAFTLAHWLQGLPPDTQAARQTEKLLCQGDFGTSHCRTDICLDGRNTSVRFFWKNVLGEEYHLKDPRDVCRGGRRLARTEPCLARLFAGAKPTDVLVMGSIPVSGRWLWQNGGFINGKMMESGPIFVDAILHARLRDIVHLVQKVFPGAILWHSYAFPNQTVAHRRAAGDARPYVLFLNSALRCMTAGEGRVAFLNWERFQSRHLGQYQDDIHHAGFLSQHIVAHMLSLLPPTGAATDSVCTSSDTTPLRAGP